MRRMSSSLQFSVDDEVRERIHGPTSYGDQLGKISGRPVAVRQKKRRLIVDANRISEQCDSQRERACAQTVEGTDALFNFVSTHFNNIVEDDKHEIKALERLALEVLEKIPANSLLRTKLNEHGWNGVSFEFSSASSNFTSLHEVLATLCICKSVETYSDDASVIKSFCPDAIINYVLSLTRKHAHVGNHMDSFYGTCMLADISGFTKLSSALCMKGSTGLDDLHKATNGFLGKLAHIVYAHGGDVIAFAGDALICIFRHVKHNPILASHDENELIDENPVNAVRALKCALAVRNHCTHELTSHIALSCGNMTISALGGFNGQYIFLLNGSPIPELKSCIEAAKSKDVIITEKLYSEIMKDLTPDESLDTNVIASSDVVNGCGNRIVRRLNASPNISQYGSRIHRILGSKVALRRMKKFIPPPVLTALNAGSFAHISELRRITTLFMKLDGYQCPSSAEEDLKSNEMLQSFFHMAQVILHQFGGFMRQFLIDDKGCVLIAMWGMPMFNHSNNCSKAVDAAVSLMQRAPSLLNYSCSIGITTGSVFCSTVGSVERRDYVGIGSKVNLAARLMCKAAGRILLDITTYGTLEPRQQTGIKPSEGFQLKGITGIYVAYVCPVPRLDVDELRRDSRGISGLDRTTSFSGNKHIGNISPLLSSSDNRIAKPQIEAAFIENKIFMRKPVAAAIKADLAQFAAMAHDPSFDVVDNVSDAKLRITTSNSGDGGLAQGNSPAPSRGGSNGLFSSLFNGTSSVSPPPPTEIHCSKTFISSSATLFIIQGPSGSGKNQAKRFIKDESKRYAVHFLTIFGKVGDDVAPFGIFKRLLFQLLKLQPHDTSAKEKNAYYALLHCLKLEGHDAPCPSCSLHFVLGFDWLNRKRTQGNRVMNLVNNLLGTAIHEEEGDHSSVRSNASGNSSSFPSRNGSRHDNGFSFCHFEGDDTVYQAVSALLRYKSEYDFLMHELAHAHLPFVDDIGRVEIIDEVQREVQLPEEQRYVILVEGAQFCDELAWDEFNRFPAAMKSSLNSSALKLKFFLLITSCDSVARPFSATFGEHHSNSRRAKVRSQSTKANLGSDCNVCMMHPLDVDDVRKILEYFMFGIDNTNAPEIDSPGPMIRNMSSRMRRRESIDNLNSMPEELSLSMSINRSNSVDKLPSFVTSYFSLSSSQEVVPGVKYNLEPSYEDYVADVPCTVTDLLVSKVLSVSQGNFYWCSTIANMIRTRGIEFFLKAVGLKKLVNDVDEEDHTDFNPLHALVVTQVDKLPKRQEMILKYAAVIGEIFTLDTLTAIMPLSILHDNLDNAANLVDVGEKEKFLLEQLISLASNNLITFDETQCSLMKRRAKRIEFRFQSTLIRNAVYELVPTSEAGSLHEVVVQHLIGADLSTGGENSVPAYASLSYHCSQSVGRREDALRYGLKAAEECVRCGAFPDFFNQSESLIRLIKTQRNNEKVLSSLTTCSLHLKTHIKGLNARGNELRKRSTLRMGNVFSLSRIPANRKLQAEVLDDNDAIIAQYQQFSDHCESLIRKTKSTECRAISFVARKDDAKRSGSICICCVS